MIILHYIPDMALSTGIVPEYVNRLVRSTEQVATSHIFTAKDFSKNLFSFRRDFIHQLEIINPDIVHIHACWDFRAALIEHTARSRGYYTVVSPHDGLSPDNMDQRFWKERLPRILLYQWPMIRHCNAVVTVSQKEQDDMNKLGWNRKTGLVPHPLTNELSDDETSQLVMALYHKVIDTNYRCRISAEEELLMNKCIKAATIDDIKPTGAEAYSMAHKDGEDDFIAISYRHLYLYAYDENVTEEFVHGAHILNLTLPPQLDVASVPRFSLKLKSKRIDAIRFNALLKTILSLIPNNSIPAQRLTPDVKYIDLSSLLYVYAAIRFCDFDEDIFLKTIKHKGIRRYTRKLITRLSEMFTIEPGFWPLKP